MNPAQTLRRTAWLLTLALLLAPVAVPQTRPAKQPRKPPEPADVARFRARVEAALAAARVDKGHWGLLVEDAETGEVIYSLNADNYFTPASNTKLFTTALAMAKLGPNFQYRTTLETRGQVDPLGRLRGDLVLVGRGDPNLSNRKFPFAKEAERDGPPEKILAELADRILAMGIKQIEGNIVGDDSHWPPDRYPAGWAIGDMTAGYGAPVNALVVNDNALFVELRPGQREGEQAWFGVEPWAEVYSFSNEVVTGAVDSRRRINVEREPGSRQVVLRGSVPQGMQPWSFTLAVEEPAEYAAALLKRLLEARGVRIYGAAVARHTPDTAADGRVVLTDHTSLPLGDAIRLINKISQNLHTEMLLRTVARETLGSGSTEDGLKVAQEFFTSIGIAEKDVTIRDGSGLSRMNLITPRAAVTLLRWVAQQPWSAQYIDSLPVAGQDGTLEPRLKDTPAAGRIRAKTGTLANSNALSGFAETLHGKRLIFSIFGNTHNLNGREATAPMDAICVAMMEELGAPPPGRKKKK